MSGYILKLEQSEEIKIPTERNPLVGRVSVVGVGLLWVICLGCTLESRSSFKPRQLAAKFVFEQVGSDWLHPFVLADWTHIDLQQAMSPKQQQNLIAIAQSNSDDAGLELHLKALLRLAEGLDRKRVKRALDLLNDAGSMNADLLNDRAVIRLLLADLEKRPYLELEALDDLDRALEFEPAHPAASVNRDALWKRLRLDRNPQTEDLHEGQKAEELSNPYALRRKCESWLLGSQDDLNRLQTEALFQSPDALYADIFAEPDFVVTHGALSDALADLKQAQALIELGDIEAAICELEACLTKFATFGHPLYFKVLYFRAVCDYRLAKFSSAKRRFADLVWMAATMNYTSVVAESWWHLGLLAIERGEVELARGAYQHGVASFETLGEVSNVAGLQNLLAETYAQAGEPEYAWTLHRVALDLVPKMSKPRRLFQTYGLAAIFCRNQGFLKTALLFQEQAIDWATVSGEPHALTFGLIWRSRMLLELGLNQRAAADLEAAMAICPAQADRAHNLMRIVAAQLSRKDNAELALAGLTEALEAELHQRRTLDHAELYLTRAQVWQQLGEDLRADADYVAGLRAYEQLADKLESNLSRTTFYYEIEGQYDAAISNKWDLEDFAGALDLAEQKRERVLLNDARAFLKLDQGTGTFLSVKDWSQVLEGEEVVVVFHVTQDRLLIWLVNQKGLFHHEALLLDEKSFDELVSLLDGSVGIESEKQLLGQLQARFLDPLLPYLRQYQKWLIVPDGLLALMPWAAMKVNGEYLALQHDLSLHTNMHSLYTSRLQQPKESVSEPQVLAIGDPAFERAKFPSLGRLSGAADEAEFALASFGGRGAFLKDREATDIAFLERAGQFEVLHFAGHTQLNPNQPGQSSLLLAPTSQTNGVLRSGAFYDMNLSCTQLVVLSGCQTLGGLEGQGDEIVGFAHPFINAGVAHVVASLWPVADQDTATLMKLFYEEMTHHDQVSAAFSHTQTRAIAAGMPWRSWAGFHLFGASPVHGSKKMK